MSIFNIFSRRKKIQEEGLPDVYQYDEIPRKLKVQIVHILMDTIGSGEHRGLPDYHIYYSVAKIFAKEHGFASLDSNGLANKHHYVPILDFFLCDIPTDLALDVIELTFLQIDKIVRKQPHFYQGSQKPDDAIKELNARFREHGVGYQYESGSIVRIDSQFTHAKVVRPVLRLISTPLYQNASDEFLRAHEYYRNGDYEKCLIDCSNAVESTLKIICKKRKWEFDSSKDTTAKLIKICTEKGLIPTYLQNPLSGNATLRNRLGAHGSGTTPISASSHIASYAIHLAATNILLLVEAEQKLP